MSTLLKTVALVTGLAFAVSSLNCSHDLTLAERPSSYSIEEESPRMTVGQFWASSLTGDLLTARSFVSAATLDEINWRTPFHSDTFVKPPVERPAGSSKKGLGTGTADRSAIQHEFGERLRESWPGLIHQEQLRLVSIESETIRDDLAQVTVHVARKEWASTLALRVTLKGEEGSWKIVSIWD